MNISVDWKCAITTSILTVLIYLLIVNILNKMGETGVGGELNVTAWYKSLEFLLFIAAILSYFINNQLFGSCRP